MLSTDPIVMARDEAGNLIVPMRRATGIEAVAILVRARLNVWRDEWFLDRQVGTPWIPTEDGVVTERDALLGVGMDAERAQRILRAEIMGTPGVSSGVPGVVDVSRFDIEIDTANRVMRASMTIRTQFGDSDIVVTSG